MKKAWTTFAVVAVLAVALAAAGWYGYNRVQQEEAASRAAQQAAAEAAASSAAAEQAAQKAAEEKAASDAAAQKAAEEAAASQAAAAADNARQAAAAAKADVQYGDCIGRVWVENTEVDCNLYWGDSASQFHQGAGCSADNGCVMPGDPGTVFVGGHTDTYFVDLKSAAVGDIIHLDTLWGNYLYKVTEMKKITETDTDQCRWGDTEPNCILYTCYPFGIQVHTIYRWMVYAEPVGDGITPDELPATAENAN